MRRVVAAYVLLVIVTAFVAHPVGRASAQTAAASNPNQIEKDIATLEQQEAQALLRGDAAALERLWADGLLVTASNNKIRTRAQVLDYVKSGQLKLTKLDRRVERVAVHGQVAIVMGAETIIPAGGKRAGQTLVRRYTDVFQQQSGQWRLIARQQTLVPAS